MKNDITIIIAVTFLALFYLIADGEIDKEKARADMLEKKLTAYRVINNRNFARLEADSEKAKILKVCKDYPDMLIFLYSQRVLENGMPHHEYGMKRFYNLGGDEQLDTAKVLLIQELLKFALKNRKKFVKQWAGRIACDNPERWEKNMLKIMAEVE